MQQTTELKKHIKSITEIKQMTRAMQLISSVKMHKAKKQLDIAFPFFVVCAETMAILRKQSDENLSEVLHLRKKHAGEDWTVGVYIFSGDQGMAGAYNINLLDQAERFLREIAEKRTADGYKAHTNVRVLGKVGWERVKKMPNVVNFATDIFPIDPPSYHRSGILSNRIQDHYNSGELDEVYFVYTRLTKAMAMEVMTTRVLPVDYNGLQDIYQDYQVFADVADNLRIDYEPDPEKVLDYLTDTYLNGMVYGALSEAYASEQTARMTAMQNATDNADEILSQLQLRSNQARQAKITNEISEIVSGAEAIQN